MSYDINDDIWRQLTSYYVKWRHEIWRTSQKTSIKNISVKLCQAWRVREFDVKNDAFDVSDVNFQTLICVILTSIGVIWRHLTLTLPILYLMLFWNKLFLKVECYFNLAILKQFIFQLSYFDDAFLKQIILSRPLLLIFQEHYLGVYNIFCRIIS